MLRAMPRCSATDLTRLLDADGRPLRGPEEGLTHYLGLIVEVGSIMNEGEGGSVPMRCANPRHAEPCCAQLTASRGFDDQIEWECPRCGDRGLITNWVGSIYDLAQAPE